MINRLGFDYLVLCSIVEEECRKKEATQTPCQFRIHDGTTKCCCFKRKIHWCCKVFSSILCFVFILLAPPLIVYFRHFYQKHRVSSLESDNRNGSKSHLDKTWKNEEIANVSETTSVHWVDIISFSWIVSCGIVIFALSMCRSHSNDNKNKSDGGCMNFKAICYMNLFKPVQHLSERIITINVDFNAWEYQGCDYLWAGIVKTLGVKIEDYFGKWTIRSCRYVLHHSKNTDKENVHSLRWNICALKCKIYLALPFLLVLLSACVAMVILIKETRAVFASIGALCATASFIAFLKGNHFIFIDIVVIYIFYNKCTFLQISKELKIPLIVP